MWFCQVGARTCLRSHQARPEERLLPLNVHLTGGLSGTNPMCHIYRHISRTRSAVGVGGRRGRCPVKRSVKRRVWPKLRPDPETVIALTCHCALEPSSAKVCAITMGSGTCPHVSTFTAVSTTGTSGSAAAGSVLPHQRPRQPDSARFERSWSCSPTGWNCGTRA